MLKAKDINLLIRVEHLIGDNLDKLLGETGTWDGTKGRQPLPFPVIIQGDGCQRHNNKSIDLLCRVWYNSNMGETINNNHNERR